MATHTALLALTNTNGLSILESKINKSYLFQTGMLVRWSDSIPEPDLLWYQSRWQGKSVNGPFMVVQVTQAQGEKEVKLLQHSQIVTILGPDQKEHKFSGLWFQPA